MTVVGITERALDQLARGAELAAPHELPDLIDACARQLGADACLVFVTDLQQRVLQPLLSTEHSPEHALASVLSVDGTLAGRAYQSVQPQLQTDPDGRTRVWLPVGIGSHRLGVLAALVDGEASQELLNALARLAGAAGVLLQAK